MQRNILFFAKIIITDSDVGYIKGPWCLIVWNFYFKMGYSAGVSPASVVLRFRLMVKRGL
jgi:hypothetical protein